MFSSLTDDSIDISRSQTMTYIELVLTEQNQRSTLRRLGELEIIHPIYPPEADVDPLLVMERKKNLNATYNLLQRVNKLRECVEAYRISVPPPFSRQHTIPESLYLNNLEDIRDTGQLNNIISEWLSTIEQDNSQYSTFLLSTSKQLNNMSQYLFVLQMAMELSHTLRPNRSSSHDDNDTGIFSSILRRGSLSRTLSDDTSRPSRDSFNLYNATGSLTRHSSSTSLLMNPYLATLASNNNNNVDNDDDDENTLGGAIWRTGVGSIGHHNELAMQQHPRIDESTLQSQHAASRSTPQHRSTISHTRGGSTSTSSLSQTQFSLGENVFTQQQTEILSDDLERVIAFNPTLYLRSEHSSLFSSSNLGYRNDIESTPRSSYNNTSNHNDSNIITLFGCIDSSYKTMLTTLVSRLARGNILMYWQDYGYTSQLQQYKEVIDALSDTTLNQNNGSQQQQQQRQRFSRSTGGGGGGSYQNGSASGSLSSFDMGNNSTTVNGLSLSEVFRYLGAAPCTLLDNASLDGIGRQTGIGSGLFIPLLDQDHDDNDTSNNTSSSPQQSNLVPFFDKGLLFDLFEKQHQHRTSLSVFSITIPYSTQLLKKIVNICTTYHATLYNIPFSVLDNDDNNTNNTSSPLVLRYKTTMLYITRLLQTRTYTIRHLHSLLSDAAAVTSLVSSSSSSYGMPNALSTSNSYLGYPSSSSSSQQTLTNVLNVSTCLELLKQEIALLSVESALIPLAHHTLSPNHTHHIYTSSHGNPYGDGDNDTIDLFTTREKGHNSNEISLLSPPSNKTGQNNSTKNIPYTPNIHDNAGQSTLNILRAWIPTMYYDFLCEQLSSANFAGTPGSAMDPSQRFVVRPYIYKSITYDRDHITKDPLRKYYQYNIVDTLPDLVNTHSSSHSWAQLQEIREMSRPLTSSDSQKKYDNTTASHPTSQPSSSSVEEELVPPTFFPPLPLALPSQELVNTYAVPQYKELNPAMFTIATFPFLYGVMFGDVIHGGLLFLIGLSLYYTFIHIPQQQHDKTGYNRFIHFKMSINEIYYYIYNNVVISLNTQIKQQYRRTIASNTHNNDIYNTNGTNISSYQNTVTPRNRSRRSRSGGMPPTSVMDSFLSLPGISSIASIFGYEPPLPAALPFSRSQSRGPSTLELGQVIHDTAALDDDVDYDYDTTPALNIQQQQYTSDDVNDINTISDHNNILQAPKQRRNASISSLGRSSEQSRYRYTDSPTYTTMTTVPGSVVLSVPVSATLSPDSRPISTRYPAILRSLSSLKTTPTMMISGAVVMLILMGFMSCYVGFIYNDAAGSPLILFKSSFLDYYEKTHNDSGLSSKEIPFDWSTYKPYPLGIDPGWAHTPQELFTLNSFKMKMAIILGIIHMTFAIVLSGFNHVWSKKRYLLWLQTVPRLCLLLSTFGYMSLCIIYKWSIDYNYYAQLYKHGDIDVLWVPPSIIQIMIGMFLSPTAPIPQSQLLYTLQQPVQLFLLFIAIISVLFIFFAEPIWAYLSHQTWRQLALPASSSSRSHHYRSPNQSSQSSAFGSSSSTSHNLSVTPYSSLDDTYTNTLGLKPSIPDNHSPISMADLPKTPTHVKRATITNIATVQESRDISSNNTGYDTSDSDNGYNDHPTRPLSSPLSASLSSASASAAARTRSRGSSHDTTTTTTNNNNDNKLVPREHVTEEQELSPYSPHFSLSTFFVHHSIHSIEYTLGCVSNTASYLRLWALSLAHAQLSLVFWNKLFIQVGIEMSASIQRNAITAYTSLSHTPLLYDYIIYIIFGHIIPGLITVIAAGAWIGTTVGVLLLMDALEVTLHAVRLHWIEFQSKFYTGGGILFKPFILRGGGDILTNNTK